MKNVSLALWALSLFVPVMAEDYKIPKKDPSFTVEIPETWTVTHAAETIDALSEDEAIQLWLTVDDAATLDESVEVAMDYLVEAGVEIDADSQEDNKAVVNEMEVTGLSWNGKDGDGACRIALSFIQIGGEKVVTLLYWGSREAEKKHGKDLQTILKSMQSLVDAEEAGDEEAGDEEAEDEE
jgi:hypothetical protein